MKKVRKSKKRNRRRKLTELPKPITAAANPKGIRMPLQASKTPSPLSLEYRSLTITQLAVLVWCLYKTANDESLGYLDASTSLASFVHQNLNRKVTLPKMDLERLLYAGNVADMTGFFWSPDGKDFANFVSQIIGKNEVYDRQWNLILNKREGERFRNIRRYIRKLIFK
jgi:hypothetical protein